MAKRQLYRPTLLKMSPLSKSGRFFQPVMLGPQGFVNIENTEKKKNTTKWQNKWAQLVNFGRHPTTWIWQILQMNLSQGLLFFLCVCVCFFVQMAGWPDFNQCLFFLKRNNHGFLDSPSDSSKEWKRLPPREKQTLFTRNNIRAYNRIASPFCDRVGVPQVIHWSPQMRNQHLPMYCLPI